jgi:hypothetical protein
MKTTFYNVPLYVAYAQEVSHVSTLTEKKLTHDCTDLDDIPEAVKGKVPTTSMPINFIPLVILR